MPDNTNYSHFQAAWIDYTACLRLLLASQPDDRPLDQYLAFRDKVISMVQDQQFLFELQNAWKPFTDTEKVEIGEALLMELKTFPLAVEVAKTTEKGSSETKGWLSKWLGRASTVTGSVKDLVDTLPPYAKGAITLLKEVSDLFKGKD